MRFISDDNKVFNTFEECETHEKELKSRANEEEKKKESAKLSERYEEICDKIDTWLDDYEGFHKKYFSNNSNNNNSNYKKGKGRFDDYHDLSKFIEFLDKVFEGVDINED